MELLAPAGSMEALRAAVCNGADAVYLGADTFNARMNARNFSAADLQEAVVYCHVRGVKVHLTLNTLVLDREMPRAAELIRLAASCGVDAFIVQDLGVVSLCRQLAPDVPIHASTQMSIHSLEGVMEAAALGCSRVVLARELPAEEIAHICKKSPVEIEVFVHGALCMCYSGQCYLSSVIGRRSGNRGQCAQPCRLPYGYGRFESTRYPLSLKDNCLAGELDELRRMGVASIKIEGRMKRPEYVAIVTRAYRTVLNGGKLMPSDLQELETAFSRQGFTDGYFRGQTGSDMFGRRQEGEDTADLFASARATYEQGEPQRIGVRFYAMIRRGEPAQLAVEDPDGNLCRTRGPVPEQAVYRSLTPQDLEQQLKKTGGTPYLCTAVRSSLDPDLMLPASAINAMRRDVIAELTAKRGRAAPARLNAYDEPPRYDGIAGEPQLTIAVRTAGQITSRMLSMKPTVLYVPLSELAEHPDLPQRVSVETQLAAILPRVIWSGELAPVARQLRTVYEMGVRQVLAGNLGQLHIARAAGFAVRGDFGLNIVNSRAMRYLREQGLDSQLLSFELTLPQIRDISKAVPAELLIYGRLPLMLMENCVMKNRTGICACQTGTVRLVDRVGEEFPIVKDPGTCRNVLLNGKKLYLLDKKDALRGMGLWALRLQFTTENPGEIDKVLMDYQGRAVFDAGSYTRGLYSRGVE
ncbi:MAG: U32 family peptidase [Oscillospiraceae bacterium]|jgi:putative protease|nr:U32 family peptidase [Oscillospiraceae bacterium]